MAKITIEQSSYFNRTFGNRARRWFTIVAHDDSQQPDVDTLYTHLMARLKRSILLVMIALMITFGTFSCIKLFMRVQVTHEMPPAAFVVQLLNVVLSLALVTPLFLTNHITAAWVSLYSISMLAIFVQIRVFENPGIILYALLLIIGPAILAPFIIHLLLTFTTGNYSAYSVSRITTK